MGETRKLAAILVSDVVGYSRLTGADEDRILARLRTLRSDLIDPTIAVHHGRVVKRTGDGAIVEFRSVVDAVNCAIEIQRAMVERNAEVAPDKRIEFRVGIHLGDVVEESDGDLMGDGVNVAARLEGICEPGGICLSEDAYRQVKSRLELQVADLGPQNLKNIAEPVRAYLLRQGSAARQEPPTATKPRGALRRWPAIAAALAVAVIAAGAYAWHAGFAPRLLGASVAEGKLANAPRMSIVVLPFANLSGDPEQEYFADGITDYLTTDLSRIPESFVIAHNTALTYKGKPVDAKSIGRELGVRYVLEGSVRRVDETVTVNAQLISTETGAHVWADRFEGQMSNLGQLQFDVVARLSRSLGVELFQAENLRAMSERPDNPDAVDLTLRGMSMMRSMQRSGNFSKTTLNEQIRLYERALALDTDYELAMLMLAATLSVRVDARLSDDVAGDLSRADNLIVAALAIRPDDTWAHEMKGYLLSLKGQWRPALMEAETAIADDRNNPEAYDLAGRIKMHLGRSAEGLADIETAFRLSPHDFLTPAFQYDLCHVRAHLAQWERAIGDCEKAVAFRPWDTGAIGVLAAAYGWAGRDKEAKDAVAKVRQADRYFRVPDLAGLGESDDPTFKSEAARIVEGLRKAGAMDASSALAEVEAVIADDPNNAKAHADAGLYKMFLGRSADGVADIETALRLSPQDSDAPDWQSRLCYLRAHLAQWVEAIEQCGNAIVANPEDWGARVDLAAAYAFAGREVDAKEAVTKARKINPNLVQDFQANIVSHDDPTYRAELGRIMEGLRKAGLPKE